MYVHVMDFTIDHVQVDCVFSAAGDHCLFSQGDLGSAGRGDVRQKNIFPDGCAGGRGCVLHIQHVILEVFIKDAGLHFERGLRSRQVILQARQGRGRTGSKKDVVAQRQQPCHQTEDSNNPYKFSYANSRRAHGGDLAVSGHAAQSDQDSHQHSHGDGDCQCGRQGEEEKFGNTGNRRAVAHHQFQDAAHVAHENDEREHSDPDETVRKNFFQDVARKDAHGLS